MEFILEYVLIAIRVLCIFFQKAGSKQNRKAGLEQAPLNPYAVQAMKETGYDISNNSINIVNDYFLEGRIYHIIVKVCDQKNGQRCPLFPMTRHVLDWNLEDPSSFLGTSEEILDQVRSLRDKIKKLAEDFINEYKDKKLRY